MGVSIVVVDNEDKSSKNTAHIVLGGREMCTEYVPDLTWITGLWMVRSFVFHLIAAMPLGSDSKTYICLSRSGDVSEYCGWVPKRGY